MSAHLTDEQREALAQGHDDAALAAHVASCAACATAVRDAKARARLLRGLRPYTLSEVAFRRVEAKVMDQVEEGLPTRGWLRWLAVLPVALAAGALLVLARGEPPSNKEPAREVVVRPAARPFTPMQVTLASADAKVRVGSGAWTSLVALDTVLAGSALSASRLVLSGPGLVLESDGAFASGPQAQLVLGAGSLAASGTAEVLAGPRRIIGAESVFRVERTAAEVVLDVADGEVVVMESTTARRAVRAPARVRWADDTPLERGVSEAMVAFRRPAAPTTPVRVDLSALPSGTLLSVDDLELGPLPFSLALEPGPHRVRLTPPGQPVQERVVELFGGQDFRLVMGPSEPPDTQDRSPEPDARAIAQVLEDLKRQTPRLRACYEKWLKANPSASGSVDLVLVVSARGAVMKAEVKGDPISAESASCLKKTARSLVLSPLGSQQELEVPLVLTPGR